ncbi:LysR substrate-binding domain-containing protein [Litorilituus lipolyticus]|uniref:LysR family transcriptional regulator n=1 Tax=Litorilituus lipolyticus TaxID=2491017 RepID=A0A502L5W1_9GAMM|nr:LysR substrate-binding domain-containing protein [Litorilituus lipolyticus]TPH19272.1 LysR family transcriptional regulator [Litorilituus lipolyticus]
MEWQGISEFVAVAENNSFTKAAKKLAISTAQVSRQVTALEQKLNIKLLYRTTRKVSLTFEGEVFFQHCKQVLNNLQEAERAIVNLQSKPQGKIKLTAPATYGEKKILPIMNNFLISHKEISIDVNLTNHQLDLVNEGYDLAIRLGKLKDSSLMASKITQRKIYLCAAPGYLQAFGTPHTLSELTHHNCLLGTRDFWRFNEGTKEVNMRVSGTLRCNNGQALLDAALKGIGIVQLPDYYVEPSIKAGKLVTLLSQFQEPDEDVWAVHPFNRQRSPKINALVDYLKAHIA